MPDPSAQPLPEPDAAAPAPLGLAPVVCPLAVGADGRVGVVVDGRVRAAARIDGTGPLAAGRRALVVFDGGDPGRPVVVGLIASPLEALVDLDASADDRLPAPTTAPPAEQPVTVWADGRQVLVEARDQLELRCGEASLTLRADGKVEIRGTHVLSRSSGPNRIKGGSVSIN